MDRNNIVSMSSGELSEKLLSTEMLSWTGASNPVEAKMLVGYPAAHHLPSKTIVDRKVTVDSKRLIVVKSGIPR